MGARQTAMTTAHVQQTNAHTFDDAGTKTSNLFQRLLMLRAEITDVAAHFEPTKITKLSNTVALIPTSKVRTPLATAAAHMLTRLSRTCGCEVLSCGRVDVSSTSQYVSVITQIRDVVMTLVLQKLRCARFEFGY